MMGDLESLTEAGGKILCFCFNVGFVDVRQFLTIRKFCMYHY